MRFRKIVFAASALLLVLSLSATDCAAGGFVFKWRRYAMDESRTGVKPATAANVKEALGYMKGKTYVAPDGKVFRGGVTPSVAQALLNAQKDMASVKEVVGFAPKAMKVSSPECALTDMYIDEMIAVTQRASGKKVDFAIANFGGVRTDLPEGDILVDDVLSMFPFKNYVCYLELKGKDIREILEQVAANFRGFQIVGGVRCVVKDRKLVSLTLSDGQPIDDDKVYGVSTISFLLNGGDNIYVAKNAISLQMYKITMGDFMLDYVKSQTAAGKPITYHTDGRVKIEGQEVK